MRATAIIIEDKKILLIHRFSNGKEYYVLPGGGVKAGESIRNAVVREVKEETSLDIKVKQRLWKIKDDFNDRTHCFFLTKQFSGDLKLSGPEAKRNSEDNKYILEWHSLFSILDLTIYPEAIREKLINKFAH